MIMSVGTANPASVPQAHGLSSRQNLTYLDAKLISANERDLRGYETGEYNHLTDLLSMNQTAEPLQRLWNNAYERSSTS